MQENRDTVKENRETRCKGPGGQGARGQGARRQGDGARGRGTGGQGALLCEGNLCK